MKKTDIPANFNVDAIRSNCAAHAELPQAVQDLAALFAEIAFRRLCKAKRTTQKVKQDEMK